MEITDISTDKGTYLQIDNYSLDWNIGDLDSNETVIMTIKVQADFPREIISNVATLNNHNAIVHVTVKQGQDD
jgi:hypothetical protein